jgi:hypothetical protein
MQIYFRYCEMWANCGLGSDFGHCAKLGMNSGSSYETVSPLVLRAIQSIIRNVQVKNGKMP